MNVIIVGCGRVGGFLAGLMDAGGHQVTIIDLERAAFVHLPAEFKGTTLLGDGSDLDVLRHADAEKADAFLALTQGDNRNIMAGQIAKEIFRVKQVIAKINDPIRAQTYRAHGMSTFSRTTILGTLLEAILSGNTTVGEQLMRRVLEHEAEMSGDMAPARG